MKVKTLRLKETKEFVHILEGGIIATGAIPDLLPMTASIEALKKYYDSFDPEREMDYDRLEVIEMDCEESGVIGADIRNKLTPSTNLVALIEIYFNSPELVNKDKMEVIIRREMVQVKKNIEYLAKLL